MLDNRNTLSTQNVQLWKLIERQRGQHNQTVKELERLRQERDSYRSRLQAATSPIDEVQGLRERDKAFKASIDMTGEAGASSTSSSTSNLPGAQMRAATIDVPGAFKFYDLR